MPSDKRQRTEFLRLRHLFPAPSSLSHTLTQTVHLLAWVECNCLLVPTVSIVLIYCNFLYVVIFFFVCKQRRQYDSIVAVIIFIPRSYLFLFIFRSQPASIEAQANCIHTSTSADTRLRASISNWLLSTLSSLLCDPHRPPSFSLILHSSASVSRYLALTSILIP